LARIIAREAEGPHEGIPTIDPEAFPEAAVKVRQWRADHDDAPLIATGNAYATSAGLLPFKAVIHAVGPIWNGGHFHERALLRAAYENACAAAHDLGCRSVAFPAISCGIFGYPVEKAAPVAVMALGAFWAKPQPDGIGLDVRVCVMEDAHEVAFRAELDRPIYRALTPRARP
jgi:O-acetyl-ADP-ribose deacetylase (regulator of RNase III)